MEEQKADKTGLVPGSKSDDWNVITID